MGPICPIKSRMIPSKNDEMKQNQLLHLVPIPSGIPQIGESFAFFNWLGFSGNDFFHPEKTAGSQSRVLSQRQSRDSTKVFRHLGVLLCLKNAAWLGNHPDWWGRIAFQVELGRNGFPESPINCRVASYKAQTYEYLINPVIFRILGLACTGKITSSLTQNRPPSIAR